MARPLELAACRLRQVREIRFEAAREVAPVRHRRVDVDPLVPPVPLLAEEPSALNGILEHRR